MKLHFLNPDFSLMPKKLKVSFDSGRCWNPSWNVVDPVRRLDYTPPINCDTCRFFPNVAEPMPSVNPKAARIRLPQHPISPEAFQELVVRPLAQLYPPSIPVHSGQGLGTFHGKARGDLLDFVALFGGGMRLLKPHAWQNLRRLGFESIVTVPAKISPRKGEQVPLLEIQVQGLLRLAGKSNLKHPLTFCPRCGKNNIVELRQEWIQIKRSSTTPGIHIFGLYEFKCGLIVSDEFKSAVIQTGLQGAMFTQVPISDE